VMEYRRLGRSDIAVSAVGFGCGGNAQLMVTTDHAKQLRTVATALDAGINFFDTAPVYGNGSSETNLGLALKSLARPAVISTKVVLQEDHLSDPRSAVLASVEKSLHRLGMPGVDVLMLHNRVFNEPAGTHAVGAQLAPGHVLGDKGVAQAMQELAAAGVIRAAGFTAFGGDLQAQLALVDSGVFSVMSVSFSALNPTAVVAGSGGSRADDYGAIASTAAGRGVGVVAMQVLGRGVLAQADSQVAGAGAGPRERDVARALSSFDPRLPRAALRYVIGTPRIATSIVGFSEPAHVADAADAVHRGPLGREASRMVERL
jgi:aryl-alcohol dehydrogenase-like predicted oxidoreductase